MIFLGFLKLSADESNLGKIMAERGGFPRNGTEQFVIA